LQQRALAGVYAKTAGVVNLHTLPVAKLKQEAKARKLPGTTTDVIRQALLKELKGVQRVPALATGMLPLLFT